MTTPPKSECPAATGQIAEQINPNAAIVAPSEIPGKEFSTLQAHFAWLGHSLNFSRRSGDCRSTFIVSRWGQARYFTHLNDVRAFLAQIGGRT